MSMFERAVHRRLHPEPPGGDAETQLG